PNPVRPVYECFKLPEGCFRQEWPSDCGWVEVEGLAPSGQQVGNRQPALCHPHTYEGPVKAGPSAFLKYNSPRCTILRSLFLSLLICGLKDVRSMAPSKNLVLISLRMLLAVRPMG